MQTIRIATRSSKLALAQTQLVANLIATVLPKISIQQVPLVSQGDTTKGSLAKAGGKDLFVNTLREAISNDQADLAVHSLKDVGTQPDNFKFAAFLPRADARDVLIGKTYEQLANLDNPVIGTASPRRTEFIQNLLPNAKTKLLRGNVDTRISKVKAGNFDAAILAKAGLERLGLDSEITHLFDVDEFVPAGGQGIIAVECLASNTYLLNNLKKINCKQTMKIAITERTCISKLHADCHTPVGVHAQILDDKSLQLTCQLLYAGKKVRASAIGDNPDKVANLVVTNILVNGGKEIFAKIRTTA